jgi:hypothetical protein
MTERTEIRIKQIVIWICEPCLNGEGEMCHVPGCALWMHRVDIPINPGLYTEIDASRDDSDDEASQP